MHTCWFTEKIYLDQKVEERGARVGVGLLLYQDVTSEIKISHED
jgi:hypothetical protein